MRPRGTIIKRGRTFTVVIDRGVDPITGRRRRDWHPGHRTRRDAERVRTRLLREFDTGTYVDPASQTLAHYLLEEWVRVPGRGVGASR